MSSELTTVLPPTRTHVATRRRPAFIAGGIILVILAGLLSMVLVRQLSTQANVIQVRTALQVGQLIEAGDLATVTVGATPGVSTVPASELASLVGQRALVALPAGSLLPEGAIGQQLRPNAGHSLVGLVVAQDRAPLADLAPGAKVRLVVTPASGGESAIPNQVKVASSYPGVVMSISASPDGASAALVVDVSETDAPVLASLAAGGMLAVTKETS